MCKFKWNSKTCPDNLPTKKKKKSGNEEQWDEKQRKQTENKE